VRVRIAEALGNAFAEGFEVAEGLRYAVFRIDLAPHGLDRDKSDLETASVVRVQVIKDAVADRVFEQFRMRFGEGFGQVEIDAQIAYRLQLRLHVQLLGELLLELDVKQRVRAE